MSMQNFQYRKDSYASQRGFKNDLSRITTDSHRDVLSKSRNTERPPRAGKGLEDGSGDRGGTKI